MDGELRAADRLVIEAKIDGDPIFRAALIRMMDRFCVEAAALGFAAGMVAGLVAGLLLWGL